MNVPDLGFGRRLSPEWYLSLPHFCFSAQSLSSWSRSSTKHTHLQPSDLPRFVNSPTESHDQLLSHNDYLSPVFL